MPIQNKAQFQKGQNFEKFNKGNGTLRPSSHYGVKAVSRLKLQLDRNHDWIALQTKKLSPCSQWCNCPGTWCSACYGLRGGGERKWLRKQLVCMCTPSHSHTGILPQSQAALCKPRVASWLGKPGEWAGCQGAFILGRREIATATTRACTLL